MFNEKRNCDNIINTETGTKWVLSSLYLFT